MLLEWHELREKWRPESVEKFRRVVREDRLLTPWRREKALFIVERKWKLGVWNRGSGSSEHDN
jgi:hypothetical protein